jgi:hypothetical protein
VSARVRVDRDGDGRLVAAKVALRPDDEAALRREAELLRAARHPGVVECLGLVPGVGGPELLTAWVGPRSLALAQPVTVRAAGTVVAALARTVSVLHERGLVHDRIDATHVLLDARGRPVLCGLAHAGPAGHTADDGSTLRPSTDVAALGALLGRLVRTSRRRTRRAGRADALLARRLTVVADQAATAAPGAAPTARALASALDDVLGPDVGQALAPDRRRARRRRLPTLGLGALLALAGLAVAARALAGSTQVADPPPPAGDPATRTTELAAGGAPVVVLDGRRYEVGAPGDQAAVADWRCDGQPIAVLHRPSTGGIFVFDRRAEPGRAVTEAPVATVAPGGHLLAPGNGDRCPTVAIIHAEGRVEDVPLPRPDRTSPDVPSDPDAQEAAR